MKTKLSREQIIRSINPHLIHHLDIASAHEVQSIHHVDFLTPDRFDILAKYIYAKHRVNSHNTSWAKDLYLRHIEVWSDFVENDGSGKVGSKAFLETFDTIIDDIGENGFDFSKSLLPIGKTRMIIDGAHRIAACIANKKDPLCVQFYNHNEAVYSADFFRRRGLEEKYLDAMALEYARLKRNTFIVCVFPIAIKKAAKIKDILCGSGNIVYEKEVQLKNHGPTNLIAQLYKNEYWLGRRQHGWPGAKNHVNEKFIANTPTIFFLYECKDVLTAKEVKAKIRYLFSLGNWPVHINDTHEETIRLAECLLNQNSIHLLNYANLRTNFKAFDRHSRFLSESKVNKINTQSIVIDSSSVMALYGLRDSNDMDFISFREPPEIFSDTEINNHNECLRYYDIAIEDLIFNPDYYLYYDGLKYLTLATVARMKQNRCEPKDLTDLQLMAPLLNDSKAPGEFPSSVYATTSSSTIAKLVPVKLQPTAKRVYRFLTKWRLAYAWAVDLLQPGSPRINYLGFDVYYSRRTTLIDRVRFGHIYEPDVTTAVIRALQKIENPKVIDIGANIGLMSFNIVRHYKSAHIYAFEPGPHQLELLKKNVDANQLNRRISIYGLAASNASGNCDFAIHSTRHASGDGFRDTGRAGKTKNISVQCITLDEWWANEEYPAVHLMKVDTEGAELLVFQGAMQLIAKTRPIIVFELCSKNLKPYSYNEIDVFNFVTSIGYTLKSLAGTKIDLENLHEYMDMFEEFIAIPQLS